eukprot:CAMPEP_0174738046 /NCGR_PEP_ID=MMETSP1094-20130205/69273_1 /TAXON_ID=156173 /ORGANISM="Chrysochromulina brevifilum, Strain UTEX LB 985" /LENGTH=96 /DNA_ID=CAMNT_0015941379 /DNA_START=403 /DNA_END=693 /DNA_ORIENTATION=+
MNARGTTPGGVPLFRPGGVPLLRPGGVLTCGGVRGGVPRGGVPFTGKRPFAMAGESPLGDRAMAVAASLVAFHAAKRSGGGALLVGNSFCLYPVGT